MSISSKLLVTDSMWNVQLKWQIFLDFSETSMVCYLGKLNKLLDEHIFFLVQNGPSRAFFPRVGSWNLENGTFLRLFNFKLLRHFSWHILVSYIKSCHFLCRKLKNFQNLKKFKNRVSNLSFVFFRFCTIPKKGHPKSL